MSIEVYKVNHNINYKVSNQYTDSIVSGKVESVNGDFLKELATFNNYLASFTTDNNIVKNSGIMPPGVRMVNNEFVVFERQPEYKNIFVVPKMINDMGQNVDNEEVYSYRIPLPWQLYIVQYSTVYDDNGDPQLYPVNVRLHFMQSSLHDIDQQVFLAPLPNFYTNGNLCRPMFSSMDEIDRYEKDISGVIAAAYDWVWNCGTNLDLTESVAQMSLQMQLDELNQTAFPDLISRSNLRLYHFAYYAPWNFIQSFLESWENIPLSDISDKLWPSNSLAVNFNHERSNLIATHLQEYLGKVNIDPSYELHYDEENDTEYQCEYDEELPLDQQCNCLQPNASYDMIEFLKYVGCYPRNRPLTYKESFINMIKEFSPNYATSKIPIHSRVAENKFESIENNILYSS